MHRKGVIFGFLAGMAAAVALMILLTAGQEVPRARAQEVTTPVMPVQVQEAPPAQKTETVEIRAVPADPAAAAPRYQIATWAYPAAFRGSGSSGSDAAHGAYVLDTHTGEVWHVNETRRPKMIQKVGKVGAE